eukprot:gnl/MRDRNA2_/MRDRNA2_33294_c0_seq1.p1 gnl/MRDRNA2_/MRDRNA2_33294_c0~~gnl/MRDRNA2_/MRDRNA2_33294_c0_seq1.p1  ORF type:complete len:241 (-),score=72.92 gnl/MRDRNA2_/MRDRNA2_33294_c0_seq1:1024-1746(-)
MKEASQAVLRAKGDTAVILDDLKRDAMERKKHATEEAHKVHVQTTQALMKMNVVLKQKIERINDQFDRGKEECEKAAKEMHQHIQEQNNFIVKESSQEVTSVKDELKGFVNDMRSHVEKASQQMDKIKDENKQILIKLKEYMVGAQNEVGEHVQRYKEDVAAIPVAMGKVKADYDKGLHELVNHISSQSIYVMQQMQGEINVAMMNSKTEFAATVQAVHNNIRKEGAKLVEQTKDEMTAI